MILGKLAYPAAQGKVTLHREPRVDDTRPYKVGRDYAIQSRPGREAFCRVTVRTIEAATLGALTFAQALAAGFKTRDEAHSAWVERHHVDDPDHPVWVITFEVNPAWEARSFLAIRSELGYVNRTRSSKGKKIALTDAGEAVDKATLAWITQEARGLMPVGQPRKAPPPEPGAHEKLEESLRGELATRFRGIPPEDVAAESPRQGTPGDVRARRRAMGLRAADGLYPVPADQVDELVASMAEEGCSVRDVALALDCSVGKAHKLLAPYRNQDQEKAA